MSISPKSFLDYLIANNITFFAGIPDSLLKHFCLCVDQNTDLKDNHIITSNEGTAIGLASGYHIGTNKIPLVYMQNSGLGNAINPLLSLSGPEVYSIPMIILIGWRGEPGVKDEPQHITQGKIQLDLLDSIKTPYSIISSKTENYKDSIDTALSYIQKNNSPYVILVKKNTFSKIAQIPNQRVESKSSLKREYVLKKIISSLNKDDIIISTTGKTSREIFEIRHLNKDSHDNDFLTIGSMGHCSSIALGIAKSNPNLNVYCIDGDGAMIMHMGALSTIGQQLPDNLNHILINNFAHESVGGQKTASNIIDFNLLSKSMNYKNYILANDEETLEKLIKKLSNNLENPTLFEIQVQTGSRSNLGRPTITPKKNKLNLMAKINELSKK